MQMFKRLLLIFILMLLVSACAKPPVESMQNVKAVVARAYTIGADRYAPGEYQLASSALQAAELQVTNGEYGKATRTLELAQRYADEAFTIATETNARLAVEKAELAAAAKKEHLKRQAELNRQRKLKQRELKEKATQAVSTATAVVEIVLVDNIVVLIGENLAMIADREQVYGDPLMWPLIYKANRDQIKNPEEIFAGQEFMIPRDKTADEVAAARREALELDLF